MTAVGLMLTEYLFEMVDSCLIGRLVIPGDMSLDDVIENFVSVVSEATSEGDVEEWLFVDIFDLIDFQSSSLRLVPSPIVLESLETGPEVGLV